MAVERDGPTDLEVNVTIIQPTIPSKEQMDIISDDLFSNIRQQRIGIEINKDLRNVNTKIMLRKTF